MLEPPAALAAGVVTTCNETNLANALIGGGLVTFDCGPGPVTIDITAPQIITVNTAVDGGGLVTIRSNGSSDAFQVTGSADFSARNLTISNADNGITTSSSGQVSATNCNFSGNSQGIDTQGTGSVIATNCNFSGVVAYGINNQGTGPLTATNCTFSTGDYGIDHRSTGSVTATNCTFTSGSGGYGIANEAGGSVTATNCSFAGGDYGIDNEEPGVVIATNCTFSGIDAAIDNEDTGPVTATNCTFSGNNIGIDNESTGLLTVTNSILANSGTSNCSGSITDGGHNLDTGSTCGFGSSSLSNVVAGLDPAGLADNGGPTETIAVLLGSPAINGGDQTVCAAPPVDNRDQRGFVRPGGSSTNCTIGAFEFAARAPGALMGAPALSPVGLLALAALLGAGGCLLLRRKIRAVT